MTSTVLITGSSSGLGKLTAQHFAKLGWNVVATMRSPEKEKDLLNLPNVKIIRMDVTNLEEVQAAQQQAIAAFGGLDVIVNNAGMGVYGALELADEASIDQQFQVNVRGPINVIRAFLPHFRARRQGLFINISSFMGVTTAVPIGSLYNMSKFALEGLTEGLYYELKPLGIELRLVEQGGSSGNRFQENMNFFESTRIPDYQALTAKVKALFKSRDPQQLDDPQTIVDVIYALATRESTQFRTIVGEAGKNLMAMRRSMTIENYLETISGNYR